MGSYSQIIDKLIIEFAEIEFNDSNLESVVNRCEMLIKNIYGDRSNYLDEFNSIQFKPGPEKKDINDAFRQTTFRRGIRKLINLLKIISLDTQLKEVKN